MHGKYSVAPNIIWIPLLMIMMYVTVSVIPSGQRPIRPIRIDQLLYYYIFYLHFLLFPCSLTSRHSQELTWLKLSEKSVMESFRSKYWRWFSFCISHGYQFIFPGVFCISSINPGTGYPEHVTYAELRPLAVPVSACWEKQIKENNHSFEVEQTIEIMKHWSTK